MIVIFIVFIITIINIIIIMVISIIVTNDFFVFDKSKQLLLQTS